MTTAFRSLSELLEKIESTKKRLEIIELTASFLQSLSQEEIESAVDMMVGRSFPKFSQKTLNVSWSTLTEAFDQVSFFDWEIFRKALARSGDIGSATKEALENSKQKKQTQLTSGTLTIIEVKRAFEAIAQAQGARARTKKERLIVALFGQAQPLEAKYLVRIFTGEMRTGLSEGLMEQAVAKAFAAPISRIQEAAMVSGDISQVAVNLKMHGAAGLGYVVFTVFHPVSLMLAQTAGSINEALVEQNGKTAFEYKYDGFRVQIHKQESEVQVFSRRLTNVTSSMPEIVDMVKHNVTAKSAILEGEVVSLDAAGCPIAFQHLMRRFKRVHNIDRIAKKIPLSLYLFDILYLNGESEISANYLERRRILAQIAGTIPLTKQVVTDQLKDAEGFLKEALDAGHEGLMAKKIDSPYMPGRRGNRWLKIKPILEPLDLIISAAEFGYGRRAGWLSDYYLAARDDSTGEFFVVGKTFKGLTDSEIIQLTKQLKESALRQTDHCVDVVPKIVVEVAYNEIQQSPKYPSHMALRFARITRIRDDKTPQEADSISHIKEIYEKQFRNKGKYNTD